MVAMVAVRNMCLMTAIRAHSMPVCASEPDDVFLIQFRLLLKMMVAMVAVRNKCLMTVIRANSMPVCASEPDDVFLIQFR